jgi:hypothetical protein
MPYGCPLRSPSSPAGLPAGTGAKGRTLSLGVERPGAILILADFPTSTVRQDKQLLPPLLFDPLLPPLHLGIEAATGRAIPSLTSLARHRPAAVLAPLNFNIYPWHGGFVVIVAAPVCAASGRSDLRVKSGYRRASAEPNQAGDTTRHEPATWELALMHP